MNVAVFYLFIRYSKESLRFPFQLWFDLIISPTLRDTDEGNMTAGDSCHWRRKQGIWMCCFVWFQSEGACTMSGLNMSESLDHFFWSFDALNLVLKKNQQKRIIDIIWGLKSEIKRFWISAGNAPSLCNLIHIPLSLHTTALLSSLYCMLTRFTRISQVRINSKFAMFTYDVVETLLTVLPCASTSQDPSG